MVEWRFAVIRNHDTPILLESFLISAFSTVIAIRVFLLITGFPQIGGGGLHIAHMLWGGLLMLVAIVLLLSFVDRRLFHVSSIVGGIGFGAFIDELGKFITADNNYFFQPTFALIYVIFISIFFVFRYLEHHIEHSDKEKIIQGMRTVEQSMISGIDRHEKTDALRVLRGITQKDPRVQHLISTLRTLETVEDKRANIAQQIKKIVANIYARLLQKNWFNFIVIFVFAITTMAEIPRFARLIQEKGLEQLSLFETGEGVSATIAGVFVLYGILKLQRSRLSAYQQFRMGLLISIFLTQFFIFGRSELLAVMNLAWSVSVLVVINYMIQQHNH